VKLNAYVSQRHYLDHLLPIWKRAELNEIRGGLYLAPEAGDQRAWLDHHVGIPDANLPTLVASGNDLGWFREPILVEHGIGQTYEGIDHPAWPGGMNRENVRLFLCPNRRVVDANLARYPNARTAIVGSPHVEQLARWGAPPGLEGVAFSAHWRSSLVPETWPAFDQYEDAIVEFAKGSGLRPIVHGHPRDADHFRVWQKARTSWFTHEPRFDCVTRRAWVYVADNTSTLYEWAALDRPVVVLNSPTYRRHVEHGLRFWEFADVGVQVDRSAALTDSILFAATDPPHLAARRREIVAELFPIIDGAAKAAAVAVLDVL
jgi:hypothetical protein